MIKKATKTFWESYYTNLKTIDQATLVAKIGEFHGLWSQTEFFQVVGSVLGLTNSGMDPKNLKQVNPVYKSSMRKFFENTMSYWENIEPTDESISESVSILEDKLFKGIKAENKSWSTVKRIAQSKGFQAHVKRSDFTDDQYVGFVNKMLSSTAEKSLTGDFAGNHTAWINDALSNLGVEVSEKIQDSIDEHKVDLSTDNGGDNTGAVGGNNEPSNPDRVLTNAILEFKNALKDPSTVQNVAWFDKECEDIRELLEVRSAQSQTVSSTSV